MTMLLLFSFLTLFLQTELPQRELHLTVTDAFGQPISAQQVRLQIYLPHRNLECVTDAVGECLFVFSAENPTLRGQLTLVGRGTRSIIWRGQTLTLPLQLEPSGLLETPIDFALSDQPQSTAMHQQIAATPTAIPALIATTEAVPAPIETQSAVTPIATQVTTTTPENSFSQQFDNGIDTVIVATPSETGLYIAIAALALLIGILLTVAWLGYREQRQSGGNNE
jgi:hypothetical protein